MPIRDKRADATVRNGQSATAGNMNVVYVLPSRRTRSAVILGPGTSSGLKLAVGPNGDVYDNVPAATSRTSVSCYISRL